MFRRLPAKDLVRNNFPISSAEGPGWQGAFDAVYTDVNKEKATTSGGVSREVTTTASMDLRLQSLNSTLTEH